MMTQAKDAAKYILQQRTARGHVTTTYALHKLLYYCQAWMLVAHNSALFDDAIVAWQHGPVVKSVWGYCQRRYLIFPPDITDGNSDNLTIEERLLIDRVLDAFESYDDNSLGDELEHMTHEEQPWKQTPINGVISKDSMLAYYSQAQADPDFDYVCPIPQLADISQRTFISDEDIQWLATFLQK